MNYYKVIQDNTVIDANNVFLKWQEKHDLLVTCEAKDAHFIIASDFSEVWRPAWLNRLPDAFGSSRHYPIPSVTAVEIDEEEYTELREKLELNTVITIPEEVEETETVEETVEETTEEVLTAYTIRQRLLELEEENAALTATVDYLAMMVGVDLEV